MNTTSHEITVTVITCDDPAIGEIYEIPRSSQQDAEGPMHVYMAFAHDWDSGAGYYDPISLGVFADQESALAEIERRARYAQAPDTLPQ